MHLYSGVGISRKRRKIHKMWKTSFLGWALASMLILTGSAFADSFTFTSPGSVTWNGVYVNPYQANDNTQTQHNPLTIYCDDWNTDFSGNPTWNATVYSLNASNVTNFKVAAKDNLFEHRSKGDLQESQSPIAAQDHALSTRRTDPEYHNAGNEPACRPECPLRPARRPPTRIPQAQSSQPAEITEREE